MTPFEWNLEAAGERAMVGTTGIETEAYRQRDWRCCELPKLTACKFPDEPEKQKLTEERRDPPRLELDPRGLARIKISHNSGGMCM